jgi:4-amino-4-deoxy-L-arabinose transferase-like glycosyltransferase
MLLITLFGGGLRFYQLTFPALWNDETLVFWRVCGSYGQMLVPLHDKDGFPPLHYSLYWWLGHPVPVGPDALRPAMGIAAGVALTVAAVLAAAIAVRRQPSRWTRWLTPAGVGVVVAVALGFLAARFGPGWLVPARWVPHARTLKLTPWVMRSVPAIAGSLTVPAMYFLARQLLPRGASLVAALVTACSAFMLFYSRDTKMYPDAWLLVTLNVGCLLWWFRTGRSTAFLGWVAAGCGMVGLHASTLVVPGLSVLFLLTQRQLRWTRAVQFLLGLALIYAGPAGYYGKFNTVVERVEANGWQESGLGWVGGFYNGNRTGPEHLAYATTEFVGGYEWPRADYLHGIDPSLQEVPQTICLELVAVLALAALPWPLVRAIIRPRRQAARDAAGPEPAWRVWLWLGVWLAVPTYGFYCRSIVDFVSPRRWLWELGETVHPMVWALLVSGVMALAVTSVYRRPLRPMVVRLLQFAGVTAALYGLCLAFHEGYARDGAMRAWLSGRPWESVWEPRYLGFMWPAAGVGIAALLMRLPTRPVRIAAVTFFCAANLFVFGMRMRLWTEPPIDKLAADVWAAQGPAAQVRTYDDIHAGGIAVAMTNLGVTDTKIAGGRYYLQMWSEHQPMSPDEFERSLSPRAVHPYELRQNLPPPAVRFDLAHAPASVDRAVFWSQLFPGQPLASDPYRSAVPPGWRLASEDVYPVRMVWYWQEYWKWVRREYVRGPEPVQHGPATHQAPSRRSP